MIQRCKVREPCRIGVLAMRVTVSCGHGACRWSLGPEASFVGGLS